MRAGSVLVVLIVALIMTLAPSGALSRYMHSEQWGLACSRSLFLRKLTDVTDACAGVLGQKRGLLFPWDSVKADLSSGGFTKTKCPKASSYIDWESWAFSDSADPALEFIAVARTQNDVAALATYMPTNKAKKIAFLNVSIPLPCNFLQQLLFIRFVNQCKIAHAVVL